MKRRAKERAAKREHKANLRAASADAARHRDLLAAEQYQSYMRGWTDGAKIGPMRPEFTQRTEGDALRSAYEHGYGNGRDHRRTASSYASTMYGYTPTVVRLAGK